jgi:hypothetical protein
MENQTKLQQQELQQLQELQQQEKQIITQLGIIEVEKLIWIYALGNSVAVTHRMLLF